MSRLVGAASAAAALLAVHTAVNARLLRRAGCDGFGRLQRHNPQQPAVSVLVPVRNEAHRIAPCLGALLAQRHVDLELLVLDDGSTDGTADVVRRVVGADAGTRLLDGVPLPAGWLGKPHACAQLAEAARGEVLVFVDADVVLAPDAIARTVTLLREARLDLVSPYPRQVTVTAAERLVQPLLQWSWLTFLPLRLAERLRAPSLTAANGQLLACDAASYRAAGGHGAVHDEVIEDVALARAFKRAGFRATVADGTDVATCRMYESWRDLRDGYTKSLWAAFGSPLGAATALALLGWLYLLPPLAAARALARGRPRTAAVPALGYAAGVAGRVVAARRTGGRDLDALAHPLSVAAFAALTVRSWRHRRAGRLTWKGRPLHG
jgi:hypothetical protein